jgi:uncharacterized protein YndB with AHSA1/START domain
VTEPLTLSFEVACPPERAFDLWTDRIDTWWPSDHTVTGRDDLTIVLEPGVGGRIFERTAEGDEHDWGEVTAWEPPERLGYLWHLRSDRGDATEVSVRFEPNGDDGTLVVIEHAGWERLGAEADRWRDRNRLGWKTLVPHYVTAGAEMGTADRMTKEEENRS